MEVMLSLQRQTLRLACPDAFTFAWHWLDLCVGSYFPITAAQRWDASTGTIENGIFLGLIAALTFSGPYEYKGKKLSFDFDKLKLKLGPWKFDFGIKEEIKDYKAGKADPFFIVFYVDEDIVCARGRGGGVAFWKRCDSDFDMKHLV